MAILLVDDDPSCMEIMCEALSEEGYTLVKAENGLQALAHLGERKDIELILLDRMMPMMDGMSLIGEIEKSQKFKDIPIIMQTAAGAEHQVIEGASAGVYYYLVKPYDYKHLLAVVRSAIGSNTGRKSAS